MMLAETLRAELARIDGIISRLRRRRLWMLAHYIRTFDPQALKEINAEIRTWKRYRATLF